MSNQKAKSKKSLHAEKVQFFFFYFFAARPPFFFGLQTINFPLKSLDYVLVTSMFCISMSALHYSDYQIYRLVLKRQI